MKKVFLIFTVFIISSCAGTGRDTGLLFKQINTNETVVFVKRSTGWQGSMALVKVSVNGMTVGELGEGERTSANVRPGPAVLSANFTGLASIASTGGTRQFNLKTGGKAFFVIKQDVGFASTKISIFQINQREFFYN